MFKDAANHRLPPLYGMGGRSFELKPGQLVLFPSWAYHEVLPFEGEGERITVAFNSWFRPRRSGPRPPGPPSPPPWGD